MRGKYSKLTFNNGGDRKTGYWKCYTPTSSGGDTVQRYSPGGTPISGNEAHPKGTAGGGGSPGGGYAGSGNGEYRGGGGGGPVEEGNEIVFLEPGEGMDRE